MSSVDVTPGLQPHIGGSIAFINRITVERRQTAYLMKVGIVLTLEKSCRCVQSEAPGTLEEAKWGEVVGRFEEVGFGRPFIVDADTVELHAGSVVVNQHRQIKATPMT